MMQTYDKFSIRWKIMTLKVHVYVRFVMDGRTMVYYFYASDISPLPLVTEYFLRDTHLKSTILLLLKINSRISFL